MRPSCTDTLKLALYFYGLLICTGQHENWSTRSTDQLDDKYYFAYYACELPPAIVILYAVHLVETSAWPASVSEGGPKNFLLSFFKVLLGCFSVCGSLIRPLKDWIAEYYKHLITATLPTQSGTTLGASSELIACQLSLRASRLF
jgi:hypothetical protein